MRPRLRKVIGGSRDSGDIIEKRLMLLAIHALYSPDGTDPIPFFQENKYRSQAAIRTLAGSAPSTNKVQLAISQAMPNASRLRLFIGKESAFPTHYLVIHKNHDTGLWQLQDTRMRKKPQPGIVIWWQEGYQDPEIAKGLPPNLFVNHEGNISYINPDPLALSHAYIVCRFFGTKLHLKTNGAKQVLVPNQDQQNDGVLRPIVFETIKSTNRSKYDTRIKVQVWASANQGDLIDSAESHIVPQVRDAIPQGVPGGVDILLLTRMLPILGVSQDNATVDYYGLHYNPEEALPHTRTALYYAGDKIHLAQNIPTLIQVNQEQWTCNNSMVEFLFQFLIAPALHTPTKLDAVWSTLQTLGLYTKGQVMRFFESRDYILPETIPWEKICQVEI